MTLRNLVGSLQISLKKTFSNASINTAQISYWVQFFVNKYRSAKVQMESTGRYTSIYPNVPVYTDTTSTINHIKGRKYLILPSNILDLPNDEGIVYISYNDFPGACEPSFADVNFERTTPKEAGVLYLDEYQRPSPRSPYFYLIRNNIAYLLGIDSITVNSLEVALITTFDPFVDCNFDDTMDLDDALVAEVYKSVLELGRFVMILPSDTTNTGKDNANATPKTMPKENDIPDDEPQQNQQ